jgi:hypothetical protein
MFGGGFGPQRQGSASGEDFDNFGKTPAEEALRVVFQEFRESAERKIKKLLAKPLVSVRCETLRLTSAELAGVHYRVARVWLRPGL